MRYWNNKIEDDGSVHCIGNGKIAAYEQGPDIIQVFGPPYSSPSFLKLEITDDRNIAVNSERETGSAIWNHSISIDGEKCGSFIDFADSKLDCIIRKISLTQSLEMKVAINEGIVITENTTRFAFFDIEGGILSRAEPGTYIYWKYPTREQTCQQIILKGNISFCRENNVVKISCHKGESFIIIAGGPSYTECIKNTESLLNTSYSDMLERTRLFWENFTIRRNDYSNLISDNFTDKKRLMNAIDDVSIMMKVQQSVEGGVLAGYNYHLGYVRDQYGVSRCFLKLGYFEEAKQIMQFYWEVWKKYGKVHNAHAMGVDGISHIHENDEVEITGYLIIQAFDYFNSTKDKSFIEEIFPMLEWAWEAQKKHIVSNMLPFNGDETYVAGGILPRTTLNDGSAEATLLFVTAGDLLLEFIEKSDFWKNGRISKNKKLLKAVKEDFDRNFLSDGRLAANNPNRASDKVLIEFRPGVCLRCLSFEPWLERNNTGHYLCPACISMHDLQEIIPKTFIIQSVSLTPLYIGAKLIEINNIKIMIKEIVDKYKLTGKLPSRPDGNSSVGYDFGYLLYTLTKLKNPLAEEIYNEMMSLIDPTGVWVEYYLDGKPYNTRCRPWESGINLEAAINYALSL